MAWRHVNQNPSNRQGQLVVASKSKRSSHPGNIESTLHPEGMTKLGHDGATHSVDIAPDYIRIFWSRTTRKLALASLPRRAGSARPLTNHRLNILLRVSWRERPMSVVRRGAWPPPQGSGGGQRPHFFLGAAFLGAAFFGAAAFVAVVFFGAGDLAIGITSLFKDILA
jgi:hypothetical protein